MSDNIRPIDANALPVHRVKILHAFGVIEGNVIFPEHVANAPTIEAEPVRHGRWVHDDLGHTYCSKCHERIPYIHCYSDEPNSDWDEEWDEEMPESAYCSHCGAKMDKEEEAK